MNNALNKYVNEIIALAKEADTELDNGCKLFLANVKNHGNEDLPHYGGADHLDWAAVGAELCPFTDADEADMITTFYTCYDAHADEIIAARNAGDYDKAVEIMTNA